MPFIKKLNYKINFFMIIKRNKERASLKVSEALKVLIYKAYYASNKVLTLASGSYFIASSTATAQATVAPTIGLLPMPMSPIIST